MYQLEQEIAQLRQHNEALEKANRTLTEAYDAQQLQIQENRDVEFP